MDRTSMKKIDITKTLGQAQSYEELETIIKRLTRLLKEAP